MTNEDKDTPFFLVGDDAFPLRTWMMKPFSHRGMSNEERMYNYRLSRARRIVENTFGILAHRWRCLQNRDADREGPEQNLAPGGGGQTP